MKLEKANVSRFMNEMKRQTGIDFVYDAEAVKKLPTVTVNVNNMDASRVLDNVMGKFGCTYTVKGNIISFAPKSEKRTKRYVTGTVTDANGEKLPGVLVRLKGTDCQTVTDGDGHYCLCIPTDNCSIEYTYLGMNPSSCQVHAGDSDVNRHVVLSSDNVLDELVVTGYQTISRERATGSYDIISGKDLAKRHATNLADALDGLLTGVQSTDDGRGSKKLTIRGTSTMLADATPLIVVDGFPVMNNESGNSENANIYALESINPNDVESVTVLKDAAAASIWGARSANGVIVITTKHGKKSDNWNVEAFQDVSIGRKQSISQIANQATSSQMINYERWCFENEMTGESYVRSMDNLYNAISYSRLLMYEGYQWGTITEDEMNSQLATLSSLSNKKQISKYLLKTPVTSRTDVSIQGGVGPWTTRASLDYQFEKGGFVGHHDNVWKFDWNNSCDIGNRLTLRLGLNLVSSNLHSSQLDYTDITNLAPYEMLLNDDGSYASNYHPSYNTDVLSMFDWSQFTYSNMNYNLLQEARTRTKRVTSTLMRTQLGLDVKIIEGLRFSSKFQYETNYNRTRLVNGEESFYTRFNVNYYTPGDMLGNALGSSALPAGDMIVNSRGKNHSALFRNDFSLDRVFGGKHAVAAVLGNEISNYYYKAWTNPYLWGVTSTSDGQVGASGYVETMDGSTSTIIGVPAEGRAHVFDSWNHNRYVSFYGNASYMYDERYGISASARSDASNLITSEAKYRWSPLWSVGAMWNISNEKWMSDVKPIDRLTLRLTYGKNGNAASSSSARTTINTNASYPDDYTGYYPGTIYDYGNSTLRWEKTATWDAGLDFALLNNHISGSFDAYYKKSTDVLGSVPVAAVHGTTSAVFNNSEIVNKGFELSLGGNIDVGSVNLSAMATYSYNYNKVTKLYNDVQTLSDMLNAYYVEGYPMASIFKMEYAGTENGVPLIQGNDGNTYSIADLSIYDMDWKDLLHYEGTSISPHTLGVSLGVTWNDLSLNAYMTGRFGGKMQMPTFNYYTIDNWGGKIVTSAQVADVMNDDGTIITNPKNNLALPTVDDEGNAIDVNTYGYWGYTYNTLAWRVESASYLYLSEIDLNYTLPASLFVNSWLKGVDVYGKVENVGLLWAANSKNYYPEYLPGNYKPERLFTIGAKVRF